MFLKNVNLMKYAICPECHNPNIRNGEGGIIIDKTYIRYCKCGFKVTVDEEGNEIIERTNISQLDKKVNEDETLRDFIKNSQKDFYNQELSDKQINSLDEIELTELVDHLDYLWGK
ncbi:DUF3797 domain-containing protein [Senegalia massiliensis]|uniref:DUF3797 domain-containing protein n=1 Tax=Senegalia massiliensis TaxID=1720316 RepID=A0A845QZJ5_9CLOT|nr:DUF3797 domain-containing protein [Senegalia massiliensis]NBI05783.1 DUF3797 domain-containing protein [Senegalia massiliensis]